jgi:hypothetical protein
MNTFTDYFGKEIKLNDKVLFADKNDIKEGEITEIFGNCFFVKGDDGYKRSIGWFDKVIKLENGGEI